MNMCEVFIFVRKYTYIGAPGKIGTLKVFTRVGKAGKCQGAELFGPGDIKCSSR